MTADPRWVVGIDPSLTSTGLALIDALTGTAYTAAVTSKGKKTDTLVMQSERIRDLTDRICDYVRVADPALVVIESATFSTRNDTSAHRRAGLWWSVVNDLVAEDFPVVTLSPAEVKKFATGKGNAGKDMMVARAATTWGEETLGTNINDIADALFLATAGSFGLGYPVVLSETSYRADIARRLKEQIATTPAKDAT